MADIKEKSNNIPELQSSFEQLKEVDADGKEWWNSRKLAILMAILVAKFNYQRDNRIFLIS